MPEGEANCFAYGGKEYPAEVMCDLLHTERAEVLSVYGKNFYAGMPAVTVNSFGKGKAYYVATRSGDAFYAEFFGKVCGEAGIEPLMETPEQVEAALRENGNGAFLFLLNHGEDVQEVTLPWAGEELLTDVRYEKGGKMTLEKKAAAVLRVEKDV